MFNIYRYKDLLSKSLEYARTIEAIDEKVVKVIMHSRRSLLFDKDSVWVKKNNPNFDVTIGSYDGAELCEGKRESIDEFPQGSMT